MPEKQKIYCGMKQELPEGYARFANRFQCLKKGYGACLYAGKRGRGVETTTTFSSGVNRVLFMLLLVLLICVVVLWMDWFLRGNQSVMWMYSRDIPRILQRQDVSMVPQ